MFPNLLSSQAPSRRDLQLPTIQLPDAQDSNTWTFSTYVGSDRRNTGCDGEAELPSPGIDMMFETMRTLEAGNRMEIAKSSDSDEEVEARKSQGAAGSYENNVDNDAIWIE
jgi:hypothetical protein